MRKVLKNFNVKTDGKKLDINLVHDYQIPDMDVVVKCEYLSANERTNYLETNKDERIIMNTNKLFLDKVKEISGFVLEIETENDIQEFDITTAKDLLKLPEDSDIDKIINSVCYHLISTSMITEEEEKNSDLGTNA